MASVIAQIVTTSVPEHIFQIVLFQSAKSQYGLRDEATLASQGKREVQTVFAGDYVTANDPRYVRGEQRQIAAKVVQATLGTDLFEEVFYQHIEYNTLLSYIEPLAKNSKTFAEFQKKALKVLAGSERLPLKAPELELAKVLKIDSIEKDNDHPVPYLDSGMEMSIPVYAKMPSKFAAYKQDGVRVGQLEKDAVHRQLVQLRSSCNPS